MKNTEIEWTDHTFNPWIGCTKISPGCKNCYAASMDKRWGKDRWGTTKPRERTSLSYWRGPIAWNEAARREKKRARVFCASLADVFDDHESVKAEWRWDLFSLISATPNLDWLLLTKRPENIDTLWPGIYHPKAQGILQDCPPPGAKNWPNIWLGTTVEDQEHVERARQLVKVPAIVHFLSCEPLLERIDLHDAFYRLVRHANDEHDSVPLENRIDWVIAGGESGAGARPMKLDWARTIRQQCAEAGVPFLFKQWGTFNAGGERVGKKESGRLLDGVQHDGYPEVAHG